MPILCAALILGCGKASTDQGPGSQFAEASIITGPASNPADPASAPRYLNCTVGLIPAYKYKDAGELVVWIFPRSSGPMLTKDCDLSNPALQGKRVPVLGQSFTAEGALLSFQAGWPGGGPGQIVALDIMRKGDRVIRVYGLVQ